MTILPLGKPIQIGPGAGSAQLRLAQSLMNRPAPPVSGIASGITALGQPLAAGLMARMGRQQQQQEREVETSNFGQMLEEAKRAIQAGQDPLQAVNAMVAVQEGPGWSRPHERFMQIAQQGLAKSLLGGQQQQPFTLGPGQKRFGPGGQLVAAVPPAPTTPKPPQVREVKQGDNILTQQFDPNKGQWTTISTAPRYKPQEGAAYQPQTPVGKAMKDREMLIKAGRDVNDPIIKALDRQIAKTGQVSGESARFQEMVRSGGQTLKSVAATLMPRGKVDEKAIAGMWANLPRSKGRTVRAQMEEVASLILRLETGAQANEQEIRNTMQRYMPTPFDDAATAQDKIQRLQRRFQNAQDISEGRAAGQALPIPGATPSGPPPISQAGVAPPNPMEGRTATGPNGEKLINRGGQWVPMQ